MQKDEWNGLEEWVRQAPNPDQREIRQAVHTILAAIARDATLRDSMIMKGGILLAVHYQSTRFTRDIDFSTSMKLDELSPEAFSKSFNSSLTIAVEDLEYDLDCRVQSCKVQPANQPEASFPSIKLKIGYAYKGTQKHRRLIELKSPNVISIDYSLNEPISGSQEVLIGADQTVHTYLFADLVAEKFRALLQQIVRNRHRRQDVYDLWLLSKYPRSAEIDTAILNSLLLKARSRQIEPHRDSLNDAEIKRRASSDYHTLKDEIVGELPDFELAYSEVQACYRGLPWE